MYTLFLSEGGLYEQDSVRVKYDLQEIGRPNLDEVLNQKIKNRG